DEGGIMKDENGGTSLSSSRLLPPSSIPAIPGLTLYMPPVVGRHYVIGVDPAEGNPNSDDSVATVLDAERWEEVANIVGKVEPGLFAHFVDQVSHYYNGAAALVERNNHGHTVIRALRE